MSEAHLGDVMMDNITFLWFLLILMCESLHVAVRMNINYSLQFIRPTFTNRYNSSLDRV